MEIIKIGKSLKILSTGWEKTLNHRLKAIDLSATQALVLTWLSDAETETLPIKIIEKRFGTAQSTTLGIINRLEKKGLVTTKLNSHRTKDVHITPEGLSHIPAIAASIQEADDLFFSGFTSGEKALFLELLQKAETALLQQHTIESEELL